MLLVSSLNFYFWSSRAPSTGLFDGTKYVVVGSEVETSLFYMGLLFEGFVEVFIVSRGGCSS